MRKLCLLLLCNNLILIACSCSSIRLISSLGDIHIPTDEYTADDNIDFGIAYERSGDLKNALRHYSAAHRQTPLNPIPLTNLGNIYLKLGKWRRAEQQYLDALQLDSKYLPAVNNLAVITINHRNDPAKAIQIYRTAFTPEEIRQSSILSTNLAWAESRLIMLNE